MFHNLLREAISRSPCGYAAPFTMVSATLPHFLSFFYFIFWPICSLQKLVAQHGTETFTTTEFKFVKIHSLKLLGFFFTDAVLTLAA